MSIPTPLQQYIEAKGDIECASAWGFTPRAVASWRRGERTPDVATARVILSCAGGELTWESIYGNPSIEAAPASAAAERAA